MLSGKKTKAAFMLLLSFSLILLTLHVPFVGATEDSWVTKAPMQQARSGLGVAAVNGKIYAIGGTTASGFAPSMPGQWVLGGNIDSDEVVGTNEEYDPETDTWIYKASLPTPRITFAIAVYHNKIYCIGGKTADGYTGINEVYDPATDTWETKTSMPVTRSWLTANVVDGKLFVIDYLGTYVYDLDANSWVTKTPMPSSAFDSYASTVFDNKIYFIGSLSEDQHYELNKIYDTETDTWSYGSSPPTSVGGGAAAATTGELASKLIYVLGEPGGLRQGETLTFVRVYDPKNDSWSLGADAPTSRYNFGVAAVNDTFYVVGGHTHSYLPGNFAPSAANEQYTPIGYIPEFPSWIILPLLLTATLFILICRKQLTKMSSDFPRNGDTMK